MESVADKKYFEILNKDIFFAMVPYINKNMSLFEISKFFLSVTDSSQGSPSSELILYW